MVGLFLCLKHQKSSQILNRFLTLIPAPARPVQPHNRGNRPINLLRGLLIVCLDVHPVKSFAQDTAEKLGVVPRIVELQIQTAKNLTPEACKCIPARRAVSAA